MTDTVYHPITPELAAWRKVLAPETHQAFEEFSRAVFSEGALPKKTKQLIAVAAAHITQCPYCINGHTRLATRHGASPQEIMEAIWVASEMRAGGAYAHSSLALHTLDHSPTTTKPATSVDNEPESVPVAIADGRTAAKRDGTSAKVASSVMPVSELDRSVAYYCDVFECRVAIREPDSALLLTPDGFQMYLYVHAGAAAHHAGRGLQRIMWAADTEAELQRITERLRDYDMATYSRKVNGVTFVDGLDPDGNRVIAAYPSPQQLPREVIAPQFRG